MIMAESTVLEDIETGKVESQRRYFKARCMMTTKPMEQIKRFINHLQTANYFVHRQECILYKHCRLFRVTCN